MDENNGDPESRNVKSWIILFYCVTRAKRTYGFFLPVAILGVITFTLLTKKVKQIYDDFFLGLLWKPEIPTLF